MKKSDFKQNREDIINCVEIRGLKKLQSMCVVSSIPIAVAYDYAIDHLIAERDRLLKFYDEDIEE